MTVILVLASCCLALVPLCTQVRVPGVIIGANSWPHPPDGLEEDTPSMTLASVAHPRRFLQIVWLAIIFWGELLVFVNSLSGCEWPSHPVAADGALRSDEVYQDTVPAAHVLVVADPQILDMQSYPDRPWLLRWVSQVMVDLNMRKSWWATRRHTKPNSVVFLGDMTDRGRVDMSKRQ
jgi:hypothetical protein